MSLTLPTSNLASAKKKAGQMPCLCLNIKYVSSLAADRDEPADRNHAHHDHTEQHYSCSTIGNIAIAGQLENQLILAVGFQNH